MKGTEMGGKEEMKEEIGKEKENKKDRRRMGMQENNIYILNLDSF
jgi:hypothetical protein